MSELPFARVAIVGLGLIGGSIALRARRVWPGIRLVGFDRVAATADVARRAMVDETVGDLGELATCDLIVLAVPVSEAAKLMPALARFGSGVTVTDVGSTKRQIMATASAVGLSSFVGGHPMAGSERVGLDYARADLFEGRPWLLVAGTADDATRLRVERFAGAMGAVPQWTDADTHDRTVAYISHLPQVVAVALMNATEAAVGERGLSAAGRAFAEMTRLASSPPQLWEGILSSNADFVAEALARFVESLPADGDLEGPRWIREAFERANASRAVAGDDRSDG